MENTKQENDSTLRCDVCHRGCILSVGQTGACIARQNIGGGIVPLNYGVVTGLALDPIEKKPLQRFFPGSYILSVGSFGCNLKCSFCQNHEISQVGAECVRDAESLTPEELCGLAVRLHKEDKRGNIGAAYTYNEPLVGWEFVYDTAKLIHKAGLKNVLVTNGCVKKETLFKLLPYIDAMNIDLKCFTKEDYQSLGGDLETVKEFICAAKVESHIELTSLIVPGLNDSETDMERQCEWIASISPEIPLHITRFFPQFKMTNCAPTDISLLNRLKDIAGRYLRYVYLGNA